MAVYYYKHKDGSQWITHFSSNKEKLKSHRNKMKQQFNVSSIMKGNSDVTSQNTDFEPSIR